MRITELFTAHSIALDAALSTRDEILDKLKDELDADTRTRLIQDFQRLVAEKVPVVPLETQHRLYAMSSDLQGYVMYPSETTEFKVLSFS